MPAFRPRSLATLALCALALPLAACGDNGATDAESAALSGDDNVTGQVGDGTRGGVATSTPAPGGAVPGDAANPEAADGASMSISQDGVQGTVRDGDTSVTADIDARPSIDIETN